MGLLQPPDLDIRDEEQFAAEAIGRVSGGLDVDRLNSQIEERRRLLSLMLAGGLPSVPICPELTNANPSSPHTVLLETLAWAMAQQARRINQLPVRDEIEFHRLFGIEVREATPAVTTLQFSVGSVPADTDVTLPAGTLVSTADNVYTFDTQEDLVIPFGELTGTVPATRTVAGATLLSPGVLTVMTDVIAFVTGVTNPDAVDSGTDDETVEQALARARNYQRRGQRLVSARDLEDAILEDILLGAGIVKAFPFVIDGNFSSLGHPHAGHTTVVVMTPAGNPVSDDVKAVIRTTMQEAIGAQFIYLSDPQFSDFTIEASIKIEGLTPQSAIKAGVESNLRTFYAAKKGNFGRRILRSEIIAVIEGTPGVDRIASDTNGPIVQSPGADIDLAPYELPRLGTVNLTVVN
jgi:uncharacterized phage protein gp47/JayE